MWPIGISIILLYVDVSPGPHLLLKQCTYIFLTAPTHICCDNCVAMDVAQMADVIIPPDKCPVTPMTSNQEVDPGVHVTPSKSTNANGKRSMTTLMESRPPVRHHQGSHLKDTRNFLLNWCLKTIQNHYTPGPFTLAALMPDSIVKTLVSLRHVDSLETMHNTIQWAFVERHGEAVLEVLRKLDTFLFNQCESAK